MKFAECLKTAREKAGLTQKELAERLNIPPQVINRYENSDTEPRIGFVLQVANALGLSLDTLMKYTPSKINLYNDILKGLYIIKETNENFEIIDVSKPKADKFLAVIFKDKKFFEKRLDEIIVSAEKEGMELFRALLQEGINKLILEMVKEVLIHGNTENATYENISIDDINFYVKKSTGAHSGGEE